MARLKKRDQVRLRRLLSNLGYGQAETEDAAGFARRFHPVAEHIRAFDPDIALVVGDRGTGKSALFRAVFENGLLPALARHAPDPRLPSQALERVAWIQAYPLQRDFPDALSLRRYLDTNDLEGALKLWFAYLVRVLRSQLEEEDNAPLSGIWDQPGGAPQRVLSAFDAAEDEPLLALDRLDEALQKQDRWIFVGYDELDTLGGYDWQAMRRALSGLIGFWASYARRWRRLRVKLFVRTDLFRRHANFGGADLAKLAANRAELTWSDRNLFAMLIKRIVNTHEDLYVYGKGSKVPLKPEDRDLGYIPDLQRDEDARPLIECMVGQFMGASAKKGRTFSWLIDHLRDGRGQVAPRNLVRLFEQAALKDPVNRKVSPPLLLHPTALRQALEDVSADHVLQGINNEWPWLHGLRERVRGKLMPLKEADFRELLSSSWDDNWGSDASIRPPEGSPRDFVEYLIELGVLRERTDDRVDVPDIYLYGLGLKRKGGVAAG